MVMNLVIMLREGALQSAAHVLARRARLDHEVHEHLVRQPPEACRSLIIVRLDRVRRRLSELERSELDRVRRRRRPRRRRRRLFV